MDSASDTSAGACHPHHHDKIKKEINSPAPSSSDEMKQDFAETAMNELLGWYGYEIGAGRNTADDFDEDDESVMRYHQRSTKRRHRTNTTGGDSSGPEYSDSGGGKRWCGWCNRPIIGQNGDQISGGFCSELCFSQSRRASFKRNRTCDWCRHVRHTVEHVDVRDGARHLQFCGDKCLNQYKMQIFCKETRAHLDLHPHHAHAPNITNTASDSSSLITPELWLKDCRTHSPPLTNSTASSSKVVVQQPLSNMNKSSTVSVNTEQNNLSPRKRHCPFSRRSVAVRRAARTSTVTSSTSSTQTQIPSDSVVYDGPQDLRVRPRCDTPDPKITIPNPEEKPTTNPSMQTQTVNSFWPAAPPPVTILVPYPVILPVPLPIPLPIPIPIPEELVRKFMDKTETTTTTTTSSTTVASCTSFTSSTVSVTASTAPVTNNNAPEKILRSRKRLSSEEKTSKNIVPA